MTKSKLLAVASVLVATICYGQSTTQARYMSRAAIERNNSLATITADHPATLFTVISTIREEYGWQIDWEAAPGYSRFDVVDATGPRWRAAHPYAKGVFSQGSVDFIGSPTYNHDTRLVIAPGGGFQYRIYRPIWARVDYEYQIWTGKLLHEYLTPQGFTVGITYDFAHPVP